ncbi:acetyl-CoA carboxylase biotin carboxyl carrier protein subunit [Roseiconus lacunae]|uniref:biotin/lipoyl-containing protein n=1 Tax=Roseiconus lacunae TaxID=2605694 RepID=UPI00308B2B00|nr:acetyl-CoA carboxylase biotin carboxyl carrier protein subunit [Stieleria sp. HD01]
MTSSSNPYAPTKSAEEEDRDRCPICGQHVNFVRYYFPFGFCPHCGNYLAVRNWNSASWPWALAVAALVIVPVLTDYSIAGFDIHFMENGLIWIFPMTIVLESIYSRVTGRLVPAVMWGSLAFPDDDRLPRESSRDADYLYVDKFEKTFDTNNVPSTAVVHRILVRVGESIERGQSVVEVIDEGICSQVPAPIAGIVRDINVTIGERVDWNQPLLMID